MATGYVRVWGTFVSAGYGTVELAMIDGEVLNVSWKVFKEIGLGREVNM